MILDKRAHGVCGTKFYPQFTKRIPIYRFDRFKVFLYYKDLEQAKHFYRDILGLPEYKESEHPWQYGVTSDAYIGLVADGHGYLPASES